MRLWAGSKPLTDDFFVRPDGSFVVDSRLLGELRLFAISSEEKAHTYDNSIYR